MSANDIAWAVGIYVVFIVFAALVISAVWRYLGERFPEGEEESPDPELDAEIERRIKARFDAVWAALCEDIGWGPCRWCGTPDEQCAPFTPCCSRCAERTDAHPVIEKARA